MSSSEIQASSQTSVKVEAQAKPPEPAETASADSPAETRFVAELCQLAAHRGSYAVLDTAFCHDVVYGTGSRSLEEAEEHARRLNKWAEGRTAWPL